MKAYIKSIKQSLLKLKVKLFNSLIDFMWLLFWKYIKKMILTAVFSFCFFPIAVVCYKLLSLCFGFDLFLECYCMHRGLHGGGQSPPINFARVQQVANSNLPQDPNAREDAIAATYPSVCQLAYKSAQTGLALTNEVNRCNLNDQTLFHFCQTTQREVNELTTSVDTNFKQMERKGFLLEARVNECENSCRRIGAEARTQFTSAIEQCNDNTTLVNNKLTQISKEHDDRLQRIENRMTKLESRINGFSNDVKSGNSRRSGFPWWWIQVGIGVAVTLLGQRFLQVLEVNSKLEEKLEQEKDTQNWLKKALAEERAKGADLSKIPAGGRSLAENLKVLASQKGGKALEKLNESVYELTKNKEGK